MGFGYWLENYQTWNIFRENGIKNEGAGNRFFILEPPAGIDCLFSCEVNSCAHPGKLFAEFGKDLQIRGGFDKVQMIRGEETIMYMKMLEALVSCGGYIPLLRPPLPAGCYTGELAVLSRPEGKDFRDGMSVEKTG